MNDSTTNQVSVYPASSLIVLDDIQVVQQDEDDSEIPLKNSLFPEVLNHIHALMIRDCNHLSINLVIITHHPNFGISGNNKCATLVRTIRSNIDSYTIHKLSSRDLRSFLTSISSGEDYSCLKDIFTEAFRGDTKFAESSEGGRSTISPSITFSMNDTKLNFREHLTNLNINYVTTQPYLPMSILKHTPPTNH